MRRNVLIESGDARVVVAQLTEPPKGQRLKNSPLVIMLHGLQKTHENTPEFFSKISEKIEDIGLTSLLYDYNEQQKETKDEHKLCCENIFEDITTLFVWAKEHEFEKVSFVTEGLGAPLIFMNLPENSVFTILLWPVFDMGVFIKDQSSINSGFDKEFLNDLKEKDLRYALENVHTPTLILHGQEDKIVTSGHIDEAREHLMAPRLDITTFEDGEHGLFLPKHEKACLQHITNFVRKHAQRDITRHKLFKI